MKRIIIFGSSPVARKCLQICLGNCDIKVVGVVTEKNYIPTWSTEETVYSFAVINDIKIIKMSELKDLKYDIGFSIRFNKIIKKEIIDLFPEEIINIHGGPLPYYRGVNSELFSLLNNERYYGVSMHYIDEGIDTGDIIDTLNWKLRDDITGKELFIETMERTLLIFKKNLEKILSGECNRTSQNEIIKKYKIEPKMYYKGDEDRYRYIPYEMLNTTKTYNIIRAFDFPPHLPAYTIINNKKIFLRSSYL